MPHGECIGLQGYYFVNASLSKGLGEKFHLFGKYLTMLVTSQNFVLFSKFDTISCLAYNALFYLRNKMIMVNIFMQAYLSHTYWLTSF